MADQTIFNDTKEPPETTVTETNETTVSTQPAATDDFSATLGGIVDANGNQKFSTVNDALNSINYANKHISTIEAENAQLKEDATKAQANEDLVAQIQQANKVQTSTDNGVSMEAIAKVVQSQITANDKQHVISNNQSSVAAQLTSKFGDKAEAMYLEKGKELGLGPQTLNEIAGTSPEAVLAWFGETTVKTNPETLKSTVTSTGAPTQPVVEKKSVMGMTSDTQLRNEWDRIKAQVTAEYNAA